MDNLRPLVAADDYGIRPNGAQDQCFYCQRGVGKRHRLGCVAVEREVYVQLHYQGESYRVPTILPASWDREQVLHFLEESTFCLSNLRTRVLNSDDVGIGPKLATAKTCLCGEATVDLNEDWKGSVLSQSRAER